MLFFSSNFKNAQTKISSLGLEQARDIKNATHAPEASAHRDRAQKNAQPFHLVEPSFFPIKAAFSLLLVGLEVIRLLRGSADQLANKMAPFFIDNIYVYRILNPVYVDEFMINYERFVAAGKGSWMPFYFHYWALRCYFTGLDSLCLPSKFAELIQEIAIWNYAHYYYNNVIILDGETVTEFFYSFLRVWRTAEAFPAMFWRVFVLYMFAVTVKAWFAKASSEEGTGHHTLEVQKSFKIGILLFIASEVMLFAGFFWAFYHGAFTPNSGIGFVYPPEGVVPFRWWRIPMLNTAILLSSGLSVTLAHARLVQELSLARARQLTKTNFVSGHYVGVDRLAYDVTESSAVSATSVAFSREAFQKNWYNYSRDTFTSTTSEVPSGYFWLLDTVARGFVFMLLQAFEYMSSMFNISDSVYGGTFYILTGLHGVHVAVGAVMLFICFRWGYRGYACLDTAEETQSWRQSTISDYVQDRAGLAYLDTLTVRDYWELFGKRVQRADVETPKISFIVDSKDYAQTVVQQMSSNAGRPAGRVPTLVFACLGAHAAEASEPTGAQLEQYHRDTAYYYHLIGMEGAIWYWHFVDVVWLFVFLFVYCWSYPPVL